MQKFPFKIVFLLLLASINPVAAQMATVEKAPIVVEDLSRMLGLLCKKRTIHFAKPQFVRVQVNTRGGHAFFSKPLPTAVSQATLLIYLPSSGGLLSYWLLQDPEKDQADDQSGTFGIAGGSYPSEEKFEDGVYTVRSGLTEEEMNKDPVWTLRILTSDQKP